LPIEIVQTSNDNHQQHTFADNFFNNIRESVNPGNQNNNNNNNNNNNSEVNPAHTLAINTETRLVHKCFENYFTFLTILFTKCK
jgi:hypothetical protein